MLFSRKFSQPIVFRHPATWINVNFNSTLFTIPVRIVRNTGPDFEKCLLYRVVYYQNISDHFGTISFIPPPVASLMALFISSDCGKRPQFDSVFFLYSFLWNFTGSHDLSSKKIIFLPRINWAFFKNDVVWARSRDIVLRFSGISNVQCILMPYNSEGFTSNYGNYIQRVHEV